MNKLQIGYISYFVKWKSQYGVFEKQIVGFNHLHEQLEGLKANNATSIRIYGLVRTQ